MLRELLIFDNQYSSEDGKRGIKMEKMKYVIIYFDKYGFKLTEEERTKKMEIYNFDTLSTTIDVLQKNRYVIVSVELKEIK